MVLRIVVSLLAVVAVVAAAGCPPGASAGPEGNRCFRPSTVDRTLNVWGKAEMDCVSQGGHLASVLSAAENDFVKGLFANDTVVGNGVADYWLGGVFLDGQDWFWEDRSTFTYTNWAKGEPVYPDNYIQYLAVKVSTGEWFAVDYEQGHGVAKSYACEVPPVASH